MANLTSYSMYDSVILIIDDDDDDRALAVESLARAGFNAVLESHSLSHSQKLLEQHRPEMILTEMILPDGANTHIIEQLTGACATFSPILIALTGMAHPTQRVEWFRCGIVDLLLKPLFTDEFIIKIEMHLQRQAAYQMLARYHERVSAELAAARHMQHTLLPNEHALQTLVQSHGLRINDLFLPTAEMAGDLWGIIPCGSQLVALYCCDVVGHGVAAAIQSFRIHAMLHELSSLADTPSHLLYALNNRLCDLFERGQFATFFFGVFNTDDQTLTYASAGAPSPLHISHAQQQVIALRSAGLPLGIRHNQEYIGHTIPFRSQDTLLLYSDALIENDHCNEEKLIEWVDDYLQYSLAQTGQSLKDYILKTLATPYMPNMEDDLTVISVVANR